jgi:2,4-dienoyl-CoA reductase (NADPH2)
MEAAIVASRRGHKVTLAEEGDRLGGQLLVAALPPYKGELANFKDYLSGQVRKHGVEVKLNEDVTVESIEKSKPDALIIAAGAAPFTPDIPGVTGINVATAIDVLTGRKGTGQNVIIIGGGPIGCETAEFLIQMGKKVTILEMLDRIGSDFERSYRWVIMLRLREAKIRMETRARVEEITDKGVWVNRGGKIEFFEGDSVVLAMGMKADDELAKKLEGKVAELYTIGDCAEPRRLLGAMHSGFQVGRTL